MVCDLTSKMCGIFGYRTIREHQSARFPGRIAICIGSKDGICCADILLKDNIWQESTSVGTAKLSRAAKDMHLALRIRQPSASVLQRRSSAVDSGRIGIRGNSILGRDAETVCQALAISEKPGEGGRFVSVEPRRIQPGDDGDAACVVQRGQPGAEGGPAITPL